MNILFFGGAFTFLLELNQGCWRQKCTLILRSTCSDPKQIRERIHMHALVAPASMKHLLISKEHHDASLLMLQPWLYHTCVCSQAFHTIMLGFIMPQNQ